MTLQDKLEEFARKNGLNQHTHMPINVVFNAGAAAMAELFAPGNTALCQQIARQIRMLLLQAEIEPPLDPAIDGRPPKIRELYIQMWGLADSLWPL